MKVQVNPDKSLFVPITITIELETQQEIDTLFRLFNTSCITDVLENNGVKDLTYDMFEKYVSDSSIIGSLHDELRDRFSKFPLK